MTAKHTPTVIDEVRQHLGIRKDFVPLGPAISIAPILDRADRELSEWRTENNRLSTINAELVAALESLLPVAEAFERQASNGTGGRRGGAIFEQARAALAKARS